MKTEDGQSQWGRACENVGQAYGSGSPRKWQESEGKVKKGDMLFVYGTLRRGASNDLSNFGGASFVESATIAGRLYGVGWFPGVKLPEPDSEEDDRVVGDVFLLNDDNVVVQLDTYEGYPNLYDRSVVETDNERKVWVYTYNPSVSEDSRIVDGDWIGKITARVAA